MEFLYCIQIVLVIVAFLENTTIGYLLESLCVCENRPNEKIIYSNEWNSYTAYK